MFESCLTPSTSPPAHPRRNKGNTHSPPSFTLSGTRVCLFHASRSIVRDLECSLEADEGQWAIFRTTVPSPIRPEALPAYCSALSVLPFENMGKTPLDIVGAKVVPLCLSLLQEVRGSKTTAEKYGQLVSTLPSTQARRAGSDHVQLGALDICRRAVAAGSVQPTIQVRLLEAAQQLLTSPAVYGEPRLVRHSSPLPSLFLPTHSHRACRGRPRFAFSPSPRRQQTLSSSSTCVFSPVASSTSLFADGWAGAGALTQRCGAGAPLSPLSHRIRGRDCTVGTGRRFSAAELLLCCVGLCYRGGAGRWLLARQGCNGRGTRAHQHRVCLRLQEIPLQRSSKHCAAQAQTLRLPCGGGRPPPGTSSLCLCAGKAHAGEFTTIHQEGNGSDRRSGAFASLLFLCRERTLGQSEGGRLDRCRVAVVRTHRP